MTHPEQFKNEVVGQLMMNTPASGVAAASIFGVPINDLIIYGALVLTLMQIGYLTHKWVILAKTKKEV